jgi:DNA-binding NarL/FixJ family response regulator
VTTPRSVLVVDDQAPFRMAARAVLRRLEGFEFAGEASSGLEAIELVDRLHPALVLMDINMPEMNGIEATRQIMAAHPDVVVILCSTYDAADLPPAASASGAAAYVNKERLAADTLRRLWEERGSGTFVSCLPPLIGAGSSRGPGRRARAATPSAPCRRLRPAGRPC